MTTLDNDTKVQSLNLLQAYQASGDVSTRNQIAKLNFGLVRKEAHHWCRQCNENYEDLIQVGSIGLLRAVERFDPQKGHAFSSFAIPYIRGEIQHYLRDKSSSVRIPRRWVELRQQALSFARRIQEQEQRHPTEAEIATHLGISDFDWQEIKLAHQNRDPISLDVTVNQNDDGTSCLGDLVPDSQYRSFQLAQEDQIRIHNALAQLEEKTRQVLEFVFLYDLTQKETADRLGISVVTVSRHMKKGIGILKKRFASDP